MKNKHIVIFSYYFPPYGNVASRRPYYIAKHLRKNGFKVSIVTSLFNGGQKEWDINCSTDDIYRFPVNKIPKSFNIIQTIILKLMAKNKLILGDCLDKMKDMAINFKNLLKDNSSLDYIGEMMSDYWELKKKLSPKVTNNTIDEIYNIALINGATGGKIIGSGGGGFLLMYCKKKYQLNLQKKLRKLPLINFKFINQGSKVIFKN